MPTDTLFKKRLTPFVFAATLTLTVSIFWAEPFSNIEAVVGDQLWQLIDSGSPANRERRVVVIDIDEASIAQYGAWPWPRERTAALLASLAEQGVAQRIVDITFPDAKPGDDQLATELLKTPTILAQVLAVNADHPVNRGQPQGALSTALCPGQFPEANGIIANAPHLRAAGAGHITPQIAADGVIRQLSAIICYQNKAYVTLALAAIAEGAGLTPDFTVAAGNQWLAPMAILRHPGLPGFSVPITAQGDILLPWWMSRAAIISLSAKDVMEGNVPAGYLKGAWALVGATAFSIGDTVSTPQAGTASGVEVHAQLLTALLDGRIPYQPRGAIPLQIGWMALSALLILSASYFRRGISRVYGPLLTGLLLLAASAALHTGLLWAFSLWLPWMTPAFFILSLVTLITTQGYLNSRAEGDLLYRNLSSYLPAHVAKQIAQQEPGSTLNAHHEQVIVLYADLRNFSAWCDQLPAEQAGALLHNFYTFASKIIHQQGGVVEEYVGDAVMGVWRNGPTDLRPLIAAKSMVLTGEELFGAETNINTLPPLAVGIGIEQGEVLVGAFGPARRRVHTLLGRTVTTAIRLQAMTGELSQPIVCGENVAKNWKEQVSITSLGNFLLQDRPQPTELFVPEAEYSRMDSSSAKPLQTELTVDIG
ncbi:MAG: adenylate/guanylate cyclase domain-containing protein [Methylobacter sp.]|nr:adenylate/guanylate cyclase domain-containing protein [Methylobacter sp.]MDP2099521.1 adenylate/guanylate cyclase domain-containing protein [Methylobacter sp.]MDP2428667.1 adenylate/guanylate cyclase domain-containing protein [Methylobacter sp.]MDP3055142.1 adenylate/guanylate cyclase domain-containing protein [Methylobacter sp.]MDP3364213.1 adenylate/guanylate cyclase domain-containing protein [Methylobacter sp.]